MGSSSCCFLGLFQIGGVTVGHISLEQCNRFGMGDVAVDNHAAPTTVQIHLKTSKCDQAGQAYWDPQEPASAQWKQYVTTYALEEPTTVLSLWDETEGSD